MNKDNDFILLIVGKSGSGKSTIAENLNKLYGWKCIDSYTTRKPRYKGEKGHIFVTEKEMPSFDKIVAYTEFAGNKYWATQEQIENNQIYIIDVKGIKMFEERYKGRKKVIICYIHCDILERFYRMKSRILCNSHSSVKITDAENEALKRIENDGFEFKNIYSEFKHSMLTIDNSFYRESFSDYMLLEEKIKEYVMKIKKEVNI